MLRQSNLYLFMEKFKMFFSYLSTIFSRWQWAVLVVIFVIAFFLSNNNIFDRLSYGYQISNLKGKIKYYENMKTNDSLQIEQLKVDKNEIEKFGREKYLMKKDNEDLFIIKD